VYLSKNSFEVIWANDIDKGAVETYKSNIGNHIHQRDISLVADEEIPNCDVVIGGFPCQDLSFAGKGAGLTGARSGLWWEFHRLIKEIKPSWVIIENVAALRSRGLDKVLGSLAEIGYDAEWHCVPASAVGAPHQRDRVWIIAYPNHAGSRTPEHGVDQDGQTLEQERQDKSLGGVSGCGTVVSDTNVLGTQVPLEGRHPSQQVLGGTSEAWRVAVGGTWSVEPPICRVADGIPNRAHRIKQLGNAVVPQIPELIGRAINAIA
jgi:DNA (cytosine-5)-methyltransferase 1